MFPDRMARRCPGAVALGVAKLQNYQLSERLYADIDFVERGQVFGVLYCISKRHLWSLDAFEGYPKVYRRIWLEVEFEGDRYIAVTYEMSTETKAAREGQPYPEDYRKMCSDGAKFYHVPNKFTIRRRKP